MEPSIYCILLKKKNRAQMHDFATFAVGAASKSGSMDLWHPSARCVLYGKGGGGGGGGEGGVEGSWLAQVMV